MTKPFIVGFAGGTGCGKGYVAKELVKELGEDQVLIISLDSYYRDLSQLSVEERRKQNVDCPEAFDYPLVIKHLKKLKASESVPLPQYDYFTRTRSTGSQIDPKPIIVVEGILALANKELNQLYDLKVFIKAKEGLRLTRRLLRDQREKRHESQEEALQVYLTSAKPNHTIWVAPQEALADLILDGNKEGPEESKRLAEEILK